MTATRISELTVDELIALLKPMIENVVRETLLEANEAGLKQDRSPLNLPVLDVGPWPQGLSLRREEIYG
jgi:hypothetical protein